MNLTIRMNGKETVDSMSPFDLQEMIDLCQNRKIYLIEYKKEYSPREGESGIDYCRRMNQEIPNKGLIFWKHVFDSKEA